LNELVYVMKMHAKSSKEDDDCHSKGSWILRYVKDRLSDV
jgi:hypothetical protein